MKLDRKPFDPEILIPHHLVIEIEGLIVLKQINLNFNDLDSNNRSLVILTMITLKYNLEAFDYGN